MTSTHTKKSIMERSEQFWLKKGIFTAEENFNKDISKIHLFLQREYDSIPPKERTGKGVVFIARSVAAGIAYLVNDIEFIDPLEITKSITEIGSNFDDNLLEHFGVILLSELAKKSLNTYKEVLEYAEVYSNHPNWEIRESSTIIVVEGLKKYPGVTLEAMKGWSHSTNENLRRLAAESSRPLAVNKWLRDPSKNDPVLAILYNLRKDSSVYVRKSVGNNLKDLSKYMPEKILQLAKEWVEEASIAINDDLASKSKKELGIENFYLIWILKHALRWLQAKNPQYHGRIEQILGKNYVLYFDEKKNKLARPPSNQ